MTKEITVCHISTLTRWGGVERQIVDVLTAQVNRQIHHILIATSSIPELIQPIRDAKVEFFEPQRRFQHDPLVALQMAKWLRSYNAQVVQSYNAFANIWANFASILARSPIYLTSEHGTIWSVRPPIAWLDRWAHQRAQMIVANSQASAKLLKFKYGIPANKIRVVYNAVPNITSANAKQMRKELGVHEDVLVVGSVGRLDTPKDFATFIASASVVLRKRHNVVFVLVGGGPLENELRAYIAKLGLSERFLLTGWRANARQLIHGFDLFVNTSIRESFGNALIEAALCGKPVIAPNIDGIPEAVIHKKTGILLQPTKKVREYQSHNVLPIPKYTLINDKIQPPQALDPENLADEILFLLGEPELRDLYGKQGQQRARELFSINKHLYEMEKLYLGVDDSKGNTEKLC